MMKLSPNAGNRFAGYWAEVANDAPIKKKKGGVKNAR